MSFPSRLSRQWNPSSSSQPNRNIPKANKGLWRGLVCSTIIVLILIFQIAFDTALVKNSVQDSAGARQLQWYEFDDAVLSAAEEGSTEDSSTSLIITETGNNSEDDAKTCDEIPSKLSDAEKCKFVRENCEQDGLLGYTHFYYCGSAPNWCLIVLYLVYLIVLFVLLGNTAEDYFCPTLSVISEALRLSPDLAGITILALGNGAPDVFSTFAAVKNNRFSIAIGELLGAGNFVTEVVVGTVTLMSVCSVQQVPLLRDVSFYLVAAFFVAVCLFTKKIYLWQSLLFILVYVVYVSFSAIMNCVRNRKQDSTKLLEQDEEEESLMSASFDSEEGTNSDEEQREFLSQIGLMDAPSTSSSVLHHEGQLGDQPWFVVNSNPVTSGDYGSMIVDRPLYVSLGLIPARARFHLDTFYGRVVEMIEWEEKTLVEKVTYVLLSPLTFLLNASIPLAEEWNRIFACLNPVFGSLVLILAFQLYEITVFHVPLAVVVLVPALLLGLLMWNTTDYDEPPRYRVTFVFFGFVMSIVWIYVLANELVSLLQTWGLILGISQGILGLTVLAWGNSIGDMISNVVVARQGFPSMAVAACFGGPLFNLLMGLGCSVSYLNILSYPKPFHLTFDKEIEVAFTFLIISLTSTLLVVPLNNFVFPKFHAFWLYFVYAALTAVGLLVKLHIIYIPHI